MTLPAPITDKKPRLYIRVADAILADVESGKLAVGDRLPTERTLSDMHSVSRTVIREAMIYLELIGIAEIRKGSGVYIVNSSAEMSGRQEFSATPFELLDARLSLEPELARKAARHCDKTLIADLSDCIDMMKASALFSNTELRHEASVDADKQFHSCIARASGNPVLIQFHAELMKQHMHGEMWRRLDDISDNLASSGYWIEDHKTIFAAIKAKDEAAAFQAMYKHIENVMNKMTTE